MILNVNNNKINIDIISNSEFRINIKDNLMILDNINNAIFLGGDILTNNLEYTYDNWYYEPDHSKSLQENVNDSIKVAKKYLKKYIEYNGTNFYVSIVVSFSL